MNRSKHYGDSMNWILKVIDSCQNINHTQTTSKLIQNFDNLYNKNLYLKGRQTKQIGDEIVFYLKDKLMDKENEFILKEL